MRLLLFVQDTVMVRCQKHQECIARNINGACRQAVNNTMQKFGLKTTKSKRARREADAEEEAEAALQFKVRLGLFCDSGVLLTAAALTCSYVSQVLAVPVQVHCIACMDAKGRHCRAC